MGTTANSVTSTIKGTGIDAPHLNLDLNLNPHLNLNLNLNTHITAVLQPPRVKEEDG